MSMIHLKSEERGAMKASWLDTRYSFSFNRYYNPDRMGFRSLRVMNEDVIKGGGGFAEHPHNNMEIITIVLSGALAHKDSMGTGSVIRAGDVQKMSAGDGVTHSEFNASQDEPCHLFQIWILPDTQDIAPSYEQVKIDEEAAQKRFALIGGEKSDTSVSIHQDARLYWGTPEAGAVFTHAFDENRFGYLHVVDGSIEVDGQTLQSGDALELEGVRDLKITAQSDATLMLFDLG